TPPPTGRCLGGGWEGSWRPPAPPFPGAGGGGDAAAPPLPSGATAEGRARAGMGRPRTQTGRQPRRLRARADRESLPDPLRRGKASAAPALTAAWGDLEARRGRARELRRRLVIRRAGEGGAPGARQ